MGRKNFTPSINALNETMALLKQKSDFFNKKISILAPIAKTFGSYLV